MARATPFRLVALATLAASVGTAAPARAEEGGLLLLASPRFLDEERGLVEALRIYTRDLRVSVELGGNLSGPGAMAQAADLGARDGAALVVWFDGEGSAPSLFAYRVATGDLRVTPATPRDDRDLCAQTLALKLRALLVSRREDLRDWSPAVGPAAADADPGAVAVRVDASRRPASLPSRPSMPFELEAAAAWRFDLPSETDLGRHAALVRLGLALVRQPVDVTLDGGYAFRAQATATGRSSGVSDVPLGLGASLRLRRTRYQLSAGPRVAVHWLSVDTRTTDGRSASSSAMAAGLGGAMEARLRLGDRAALFVGAAAEALVPRHRFFVDDAVVDLGAWLVQVGAGVVIRLW